MRAACWRRRDAPAHVTGAGALSGPRRARGAVPFRYAAPPAAARVPPHGIPRSPLRPPSDASPPAPDPSRPLPGPAAIAADSDLYQQRLPAWQPILTPKWVVATFLLVGVPFVIIGAVCKNASDAVVEMRLQYDGAGADPSAANCSLGASWNGTATCRLELTVPAAMAPPVFVYYEMTNFYQNHRRFVKNRDDQQLAGLVTTSLSDPSLLVCDPLRSRDGVKVLHPCGLMANSFFNDTFALSGGALNHAGLVESWSEKDISWASDRRAKFVKVDQSLYRDKVQYINDTYPGIVSNVDDEHFIVWMRPAALPNFRKLYAVINKGLTVNQKISFDVAANFPVSGYGGTKAIVVTTLSFLGGKNAFIGGAYLVVGGLCIAVALLFALKQAVWPGSVRKLGDASYLVAQNLARR